MQESLYQTADEGESLSDSRCRGLSIRKRMKETLSDSGCRSLSIRQRMQESLCQTADAGVSLSDSGCRSISIRQLMQESLHQTADAEVSPSDSGCRIISILQGAQWLSGRVLDSRPKGRGFEPHRRHCVVSLSKNINPSLVLV